MDLRPPYSIQFPDPHVDGKRELYVSASKLTDSIANTETSIKFTTDQIEAIISGSSKGLTIITGTRGTGKSSVLAQSISNLYHTNQQSITLVITKSQHGLDILRSKLNKLIANPRKIHELEYFDNGPKRVQKFLAWKMDLLKSASSLCISLGRTVAYASDCEQALYFFHSIVEPLYKNFKEMAKTADYKQAAKLYPFTKFHEKKLFERVTKDNFIQLADDYFKDIQELFKNIDSMRPLELLRLDSDRSDYLLVKETRVLLMTSCVASIRRRQLSRLGFKYQNLIFDEAEQLLEIETLGPLMNTDLLTVILCGDNQLLSPKVYNSVCASYGRLSKSLIGRLIENEYPTIELRAQFNARPEIVDTFSFAYPELKSIPNDQFKYANAGLAKSVQFVNVEDFKNQGETAPHSGFYQNIGEAEFVIATFMYLKLLK